MSSFRLYIFERTGSNSHTARLPVSWRPSVLAKMEMEMKMEMETEVAAKLHEAGTGAGSGPGFPFPLVAIEESGDVLRLACKRRLFKSWLQVCGRQPGKTKVGSHGAEPAGVAYAVSQLLHCNSLRRTDYLLDSESGQFLKGRFPVRCPCAHAPWYTTTNLRRSTSGLPRINCTCRLKLRQTHVSITIRIAAHGCEHRLQIRSAKCQALTSREVSFDSVLPEGCALRPGVSSDLLAIQQAVCSSSGGLRHYILVRM